MHTLDWLGPFALRRGDSVVPVTIRKLQALLVLLAREGSMPRERVVALLWPRLDESTARRNLRRELARLRDAGAGDVVQADGDRLLVDAGVDITARRFEALLRDQQADDALTLWRGAPAEGLRLDDAEPWNEWLAAERVRLEGLRAQALALSAAQHDAAGEPARALDRIHSLLDADPLQEQHHLTAMRLLDRLGRREAALAQYDICARLLADELGLQPMAATRALARALRGEGGEPPLPIAAPPPRPASDLLPERLPLVGRDAELRWLQQVWPSRRLLLIEGDGGVGKTRLVTTFAAEQGAYAIVPCRAGDAELPLASYARGLRALAGPEPALEGLPGWVRDELPRLLPELGPAPPPLRSEDERMRFTHACTHAWQHWAEGNFDAVIVDDWHLADPGSQALWMQTHAASEGSVRVVLVYRPALTPAAADRLVRAGQGGAAQLRVRPLSADAVYALVRQLSRRPDPRRFAAMLARATDGNPFYVAETLRHLVERGLLYADARGGWSTPFDDSTDDYQELPLPDSVRTAVLARVARLPERTQRVLEAAALADEPFGAALLAPACALSEVEATLALEDALQARLLREGDEGGLAFAHDLVQQALDSGLDPARRRSVHRRLALGAEAAGAPAATIARHHEAGGDRSRALPFRIRAGDAAMQLHAWRDAALHWQRGLADQPSPAQCLDLRLRLLQAAGALASRPDVLEHGAALFRLGQDDALTQADRVRAVAQAAHVLAGWGAPAESLAALDRLPRQLPAAQQRLVLLARSLALLFQGQGEAARALAHGALDDAGTDVRPRADALYRLGANELVAGRLAAAAEHLETAIALQRSLPDGQPVDLLNMTLSYSTVLYHLGRFEEAGVRQEETADGAVRIGHRRLEARARFNLASVRISQGRADASLELARQVRTLVEGQDDLEFSAMLRSRFVEALAMLGQLGAAYAEARQAVPEILASPRRPYTLIYVATHLTELLELLGDRTTLQPLFDAIDRLQSDDPRLLAGLTQISLEYGLARAQAAMLAGNLHAAAAALQRIDADLQIEDPRVRQRVQIVRAEFALYDGRADDAAALLPPPATITPADGLRLRAWAQHLRAESARAACDLPLLAAAREALHAPAPQIVPAIPALHLHRALVQAVATLRPALAGAVRADASLHVNGLASHLASWPDLQAAFRLRWSS